MLVYLHLVETKCINCHLLDSIDISIEFDSIPQYHEIAFSLMLLRVAKLSMPQRILYIFNKFHVCHA